MTCQRRVRRTRRGKTSKNRRTTPIANGISGLPCVNESLPTVSLLGGRTNVRQALRLLLKDLNAKRLHTKE